jgi:hypothetical protein
MQGFQPGSYQLYACAVDTYNARTCSSVSVTVNQPVAESAEKLQQLVQDSVAKIDVVQLASTGEILGFRQARSRCTYIKGYGGLGPLIHCRLLAEHVV